MSKRSAHQQGFTLIELMIVVAILGILAAVAIPAFLEYMRKGKNSEAQVTLNKIGKGAKEYYIREATFPQGTGVEVPASVAASSYCSSGNSAVNEWYDPSTMPVSGVGGNAWHQMEMSIATNESLRFTYQYESLAVLAFVATATSDLNCDGTLLTWTATGEMSNSAAGVRLIQATAD